MLYSTVKKLRSCIFPLSLSALFISFASCAAAADSLLAEIPVRASLFTTDHLFNLYYINAKKEIVRYHTDDGSTITYSNLKLGTPVSMDASNPLKVLVFYPDFNALVLLDNTFAALTVLNLNRTPDGHSYKPAAVCKEAETDYIWIYDELTRRLIRIDEQGNLILQSEAFDQLFSDVIVPVRLVYADTYLYLLDKSGKILVFDRFGNFFKTLDVQAADFLQADDHSLLYIDSGKLRIFDMLTYSIRSIPLSPGTLQAELQKQILFLRLGDSLRIIRLQGA